MKKNLLILLIAIFSVAVCAFFVTSCKDEDEGVNVLSAYIDDGELYLILSSGVYINCGQVSGTDGIDGIDGINGVGITKILTDNNGNIVVYFANGSSTTVEVAVKPCSHTFSAWKGKQATCTTQGYRTRTCSQCGYTEHEIIEALGHDWDHDHTDVLVERETCTDEGWHILTCNTCGETKMEKIEAGTHLYNGIDFLPDDTMVRYCIYCGMRQASEGLVFERVSSGFTIEYALTSLGTCTDKHVVVPDIIDTPYGEMPVTRISKDVFTNNSEIESLYLSKYITNIEVSAPGMFAYCPKLTSITIHPKNPVYRSDGNCIVDIYNKKVIAGCTGSVIPSDGSVTTIGQSAFYGLTEMTKLVIPDKIVTLESYAFGRCTGLTELYLGGATYQLNEIGAYCFYQCTGLEKVTITNVPTIGISAFEYCTGLQEVILDKGCEYVMGSAFIGCVSLKTLRVSSTVVSIKSCAFGACGELSDIYFQNTTDRWSKVFDGLWSMATNMYPSSVFKETPSKEDINIHYEQF